MTTAFQEFTPLEYILIDVANRFGLDKKIYAERLEFARQNQNNLFDIVHEADDPNMFHRAALAYEDAMEGNPTGYYVGFDSMASGIQILSTLAKCHTGMKNTGVLNSDSNIVPDVYRITTDHMGMNDYPRKAVKQALMTYAYGSEAQPVKLFGKGDTLKAFFEAAIKAAPEAMNLRNIMLNLWQPNALHHEWDALPDGHTVFVKELAKKEFKIKEDLLGHSLTYVTKINQGAETGLKLAANITHGCDAYIPRELARRCNYDTTKLNAIYSMLSNQNLKVTDRTNMVSNVLVELPIKQIEMLGDNELALLLENVEQSLEHKSFQVVSIHDEFGCSPLYMNHLRKHYNKIMYEFYHSNLLPDIFEQISGDQYIANPVSNSIAKQIKNSNYAIN